MKPLVAAVGAMMILAATGMTVSASAAAEGRSGGERQYAGAINGFALNLFQQLRIQEGNLPYSPFSVHTALTMILAGARGETESQMIAALQLSELEVGREAPRQDAGA